MCAIRFTAYAFITLSLGTITACGGARRGPNDVRTVGAQPPPPATGGASEAELFESAEATLLRALALCPGRSVVFADAQQDASVQEGPCDDRTAAALLDDATRVLDVLMRCRGQSDACRAAARAGASASTSSAAGACATERASERAAWREAALGLTTGAQLDCRILGGAEGTSLCSAPTGPSLRLAALGALEIAATPRRGDAVDGLASLIDTATRRGSVGAQGPWIGAMVGPAESARQARWACETEPAWREGQGLTSVVVPSSGFRLSVPQGTRTAPGLVQPREGLPISVGFTTRALAEVLASSPESCRALDTRDPSMRGLDCAGPDLVSPNRELTLIVDAGDVRGLAVVRVRHDASRAVVATWLAILRTLTRTPGAPPLDAAQLGAHGDLADWPVARVASDGALHLSDSVVPRRGERTAMIAFAPDAGVCAQARTMQSEPGRTLLDDTALDDGGCHHAVLVEERTSRFVLTLHVRRRGEQFVVVQHLSPAGDEAAARAQLDATRASVATLLGTTP